MRKRKERRLTKSRVIRVHEDVVQELLKLKEHPRETFNDLLVKILKMRGVGSESRSSRSSGSSEGCSK